MTMGPVIRVRVRFFAALREQFGDREGVIEVARGASVGEVLAAATGGAASAGSTLAALNHEYAAAERVVEDGDQVAFFPPVTGG